MDLSTLLLGAMLAVLALAGAGLLAAMVLLERRPDALGPVPALAGPGHAPSKPCARRGRAGNGRRRRART